MNTRFDVGDEVFVKAKINSLFRGYDSNGVFRDEYELRFDDHVDIRMLVPENKLYPVANPGKETVDRNSLGDVEENQNSCEHCCNDCKYFKEYDTMTFLTYNCSKNKEAVNFWQVACDDFEAKEEK